jgi:hypothetical protein
MPNQLKSFIYKSLEQTKCKQLNAFQLLQKSTCKFHPISRIYLSFHIVWNKMQDVPNNESSGFKISQKPTRQAVNSSAYRWNSRPRVLAIDRPTLVLPTPGGPTKHRIGPRRLFLICLTARYSMTRFFSFSRP